MHVAGIVLLLILEIPVAIVSTLLAVRLLGTRRSWVATTFALDYTSRASLIAHLDDESGLKLCGRGASCPG